MWFYIFSSFSPLETYVRVIIITEYMFAVKRKINICSQYLLVLFFMKFCCKCCPGYPSDVYGRWSRRSGSLCILRLWWSCLYNFSACTWRRKADFRTWPESALLLKLLGKAWISYWKLRPRSIPDLLADQV